MKSYIDVFRALKNGVNRKNRWLVEWHKTLCRELSKKPLLYCASQAIIYRAGQTIIVDENFNLPQWAYGYADEPPKIGDIVYEAIDQCDKRFYSKVPLGDRHGSTTEDIQLWWPNGDKWVYNWWGLTYHKLVHSIEHAVADYNKSYTFMSSDRQLFAGELAFDISNYSYAQYPVDAIKADVNYYWNFFGDIKIFKEKDICRVVKLWADRNFKEFNVDVKIGPPPNWTELK